MSKGVVFISGAGLKGWIWDGVTKDITVPYVTVDYSGLDRATNKATLEQYVTAALEQANSLKVDSIIIVAHSVGGVVGLELAKRLSNKLGGFIAVCASLPKPNNSFVSSLPFPQKLIMPLVLKFAGTKPPESAIRNSLASSLEKDVQNKIVSDFQQESRHLFTDRISSSSIPNVPTAYILTANDKEIPTSLQRKFAANIPAKNIVEISSGHLPMITHANEVATAINATF